jgi:hypothetical protein
MDEEEEGGRKNGEGKVMKKKKTCCLDVNIAQIFQKKYKNLTFRIFFSRIFAKLSSVSANGEDRIRKSNLLSRGYYCAVFFRKV